MWRKRAIELRTVWLRRELRSDSSGFTIVELMIYLVMALVVVGAVFGVLISQWRQFGLHRETIDARETLRGAGALLTSELRGASASGGDLYAIAPQSITMRSVQATGVICAKHIIQPRYGLFDPSGTFTDTAEDSVLVYSQSGGTWKNLGVFQAWPAPAAAGVGTCDWAAGQSADQAIEPVVTAPADTAGVWVGSGLKAFRRVQYGMFQLNGRWWLGRKLGAAASYELVTGPLRAPADSGLVFHYYNAAGAETAVPADVVRVEIELRSESAGRAGFGGNVGFRRDSLTVNVFLRN